MIGRLNHVAIAVRDIAKAAKVYRDTLGAEVSAKVPQPEHGVSTVFITLPNTKIELLEPLGDEFADRQISRKESGRRHPSRLLRGGRHPRRARHAQGARRARARRRRAENRRARQAGAVPASEGFLRHAGRARAGVTQMAISTVIAIYFLIWWLTLFAVLPWGVRNQEESGEVTPGTDPGAPALHRVWSKLVWTTVVATVIFGVLYFVYSQGLIPYDVLMAISGPRAVEWPARPTSG